MATEAGGIGQASAEVAALARNGALAGRWTLDPHASSAEFRVRHFWGAITVRGRFERLDGEGAVGPDGSITGRLVIDGASLTAQNKQRDKHLRSADFFHGEEHPQVVLTVSRASLTDDGRVAAEGMLAAAGVSEPAGFTADIVQASPDAVTLRAEVTVDRSRYGMTWSPMRMAAMHATGSVTARFTRARPTRCPTARERASQRRGRGDGWAPDTSWRHSLTRPRAAGPSPRPPEDAPAFKPGRNPVPRATGEDVIPGRYGVRMSRYRLMPSPAQEATLLAHCAHARYVRNLCVEQESHWRPGRARMPGFAERCRQLSEARAAEPWLAAGSVIVQQQAIRDHDQAMANFFAGTHRRPRWRKADRDEGFRIVHVSPGEICRLSSQRCSACGHVAAESRESQALFACVACGFACNADVNAARNIAAGHAVTARGGDGIARPVNREPQPVPVATGWNPRLQAGEDVNILTA